MVGAREEEVLRDGELVTERVTEREWLIVEVGEWEMVTEGERLSVEAREEEVLREGVSGPERVAEGE